MRGGVFLKNDLNVKLISMEDIMAAKCCDIQEVVRVIEEVLVEYAQRPELLDEFAVVHIVKESFDVKLQNIV